MPIKIFLKDQGVDSDCRWTLLNQMKSRLNVSECCVTAPTCGLYMKMFYYFTSTHFTCLWLFSL